MASIPFLASFTYLQDRNLYTMLSIQSDGLCYTGHLRVVELLIAAGADVHIKNSKSLTAVGCAANNGQAEVVLKLVSSGAAWRNLPDMNVVRTICRKTNYKYVASRGFVLLYPILWNCPLLMLTWRCLHSHVFLR